VSLADERRSRRFRSRNVGVGNSSTRPASTWSGARSLKRRFQTNYAVTFMRQLWKSFLELIWSSRYDPIASRQRRIALLQAILAIAISVAAGPEIFVAIEMTAVMEILGAVLFLAAMSAGAKLIISSIWSAIRNTIFPIPLPFVVRRGASIPANVFALICITGHAAWCVAMALSCQYVWASDQS